MFSDTLDEFDDSRQVVQDLIEEYEACETPDYVNYVSANDLGNGGLAPV
jgi:tubulin gamma